jgi:hypothetical protein
MNRVIDILVVVAALGFGYWGWLAGSIRATVAALEVVACLACAVVLHEWLAGGVHGVLGLLFGDSIPQGWSVLVAFAGLAWGVFALLRTQLHRQPADEEDDEVDPLIDRLLGAVAGVAGGIVFVGGVLVTLSMLPLFEGLKPSGDRLLLDAGKLALVTTGQFVTEKHDGRVLPIWGEPPSRVAVLSAGLASDPWFDVNEDGVCGDEDRYRDVDGNGTFSKDLYYEDVDRDGLRRVGLIDKYVVARWDAGLTSDDRPRADLKKPAPPKPAPPAPPPRQEVAPQPPAPAPAKPDSAKPPKAGERKPTTKPAADDKPVTDDF